MILFCGGNVSDSLPPSLLPANEACLSPVRGGARSKAETAQLGTGHAGHDALVEVLPVVNLREKAKSLMLV